MICKYLVIHHSATDPNASVGDLASAHLSRGFDEIGYHYIVDRFGRIHAGRSENQQGAHAFGLNSESIGVCCIGNFEEYPVPIPQLEGLVCIIGRLAAKYEVDLGAIIGHGEISGWIPEATKTACPGTYLKQLLPVIRERVAAKRKADPTAPVINFKPDDKSGLLTLRGTLMHPRLARLARWEETDEMLSHVRVKLISQNGGSVEWMNWARTQLVTTAEDNSYKISFSMSCPQSTLAPGEYQLIADPCSKEGRTSSQSSPPLMACQVRLPISNAVSYQARAYRAHVSASLETGKHPFILKVSGQIVNIGGMGWYNDDENLPFRLGALLVPETRDSKPVSEFRYDFSYNVLEAGGALPFQFTLNLYEFSAGNYFLHIDMLRERSFWFSEIGSEGTTVSVTVPEVVPRLQDEVAHLTNPRVSYADGTAKGKLLYLAPTLPLFDRSSGGRRLMDIFKILRSRGVEITFLYQQLGTFTAPDRYFRALDSLGVIHASDPLGYLAARENNDDYNLCVLGWYTFASSILPAIRELLPRTRVAIDSVDIHWIREERGRKAGHAAGSEADQAMEKKKEIALYSRADEVWVVSEEDRAFLATELPGMKTRIIGIPAERHSSFLSEVKGKRALFVGGFAHPPNESAALWAAEIISLYNETADEPIGLDIVGADPPAPVKQLHDGERIRVAGYVPSLDAFFEDAKFFLAPMRYGAGVKGKVCEAICRGLPILTNRIGNEGINLRNGREAFLAESSSEFASAIQAICSDEIDLNTVRNNALDALLKESGPQVIEEQLMSAVAAPSVVIAIVTYNQKNLLLRCLSAIFDQTNYPNFKVSVISNGCSDGSPEVLSSIKSRYPHKIDIHLSSANDFFVRPTNKLIKAYPQSDIVLMNNDVEVVNRGWLTNLVDAAYSAPKICCAGGKILDSEGKISEAGAEIYSSGFGRNFARGLPSDSPAAAYFRFVGFVSGCLMYMRRDAINDIGCLDDDFHPMYFEDVAWNYRAHLSGWKTVYTPLAIAIHNEGSSAGRDTKTGMKRFQEVNRLKFLAKFADIVVEEFNG